MHGVVAALGRPDRPRDAGVAGTGRQGVVRDPCAPCARSGGSAAGRRRRSPSPRWPGGARPRSRTCPSAAGRGWRPRTAGRTRTRLPYERPLPLDVDRYGHRRGDVLAQRVTREQLRHGRVQGDGEPRRRRVARCRCSAVIAALSGSRALPRGRLASARSRTSAPSSSSSSTSRPAGTLISARCRHVSTGSPQASTVIRPVRRSRSGVTSAVQRSGCAGRGASGRRPPCRPARAARPWRRRRRDPRGTRSPLTVNVSPTTAFTGRVPSATTGATSSIA